LIGSFFFKSDLCQHRNLFFIDRQVVDGCAWWVRELLGGSVGPWAGSPTIANTTHQHFLLSDACQGNNLVQWVVLQWVVSRKKKKKKKGSFFSQKNKK